MSLATVKERRIEGDCYVPSRVGLIKRVERKEETIRRGTNKSTEVDRNKSKTTVEK